MAGAGILAWAAAVFLLFFFHARSLTGSMLGSLATLGLGVVSTYAFWLSGFRIWRRIAARFQLETGALERSVLEMGLGIAAIIPVMFLLGAAGFFKPWAAWALLALTLAGPHASFIRDLRGRFDSAIAAGRGARRSVALPLILFSIGGMTLIESLAPVTSQDALVYHLAIPARYIEHGGFTHVKGSFFALFPQNIEMLFTFGLLLRDESLAQWYHWMLGAAAAASVAALARRIDSRASGLAAAAVFATIPTVALIAGWAYVDLGVVFFITLSTMCFLRWCGSEARALLVLSALFAGVAAGCKYTAGFQGLLVAGGVFVLGASRRWALAKTARQAALAAGMVGAVVGPWWIRNVIYTGNPLFPFCYGIFGGEGWDSERAQVLAMALGQWGGERGLLETLGLPWRLTMSGQFFSEVNFDGMIGCAFLLAAPLLVASLRLSREHRVAAAFVLAHAAFWALTTRQVRFLLPALASASALIGAALPVLLSATWVRAGATAILNAALALNVLIASLYFAHHNPLPVVLGLETRSAYLGREVPGGDYAVFEHIERSLPRDSYILFGSLGNPGFLAKRRYYSDAFFENRTLAEVLAGAAGPDDAWRALRSRGFTHLLFRGENVFDATGTRSEIPVEDQKKLMELLNRHARLLCQANGTVLYALLGSQDS